MIVIHQRPFGFNALPCSNIVKQLGAASATIPDPIAVGPGKYELYDDRYGKAKDK